MITDASAADDCVNIVTKVLNLSNVLMITDASAVDDCYKHCDKSLKPFQDTNNY